MELPEVKAKITEDSQLYNARTFELSCKGYKKRVTVGGGAIGLAHGTSAQRVWQGDQLNRVKEVFARQVLSRL
jgi:hypothetical protein